MFFQLSWSPGLTNSERLVCVLLNVKVFVKKRCLGIIQVQKGYVLIHGLIRCKNDAVIIGIEMLIEQQISTRLLIMR